MHKRLFLLLIVLLNFITLPTRAANMVVNPPIDIKVNESFIRCDVDPFIISGTTYVPVRFISEALSADEVSWDSNNNTATIKYNGNVIELTINKNYGYINGKYVAIKNGVKLVNDRTFVPVRFIAENMGAAVSWSSDYLTVSIKKDDIKVSNDATYDRGYSNEDVYWLSRIVESEASGEPFDGKLAVGNVVLNRAKSDEYPDTIYEVIFDRKNGVQFEPVSNGTIYNTPTYESIVAAKCALEGKNIVGESLFFFNPAIAASRWIENNRTYNMTIGNHCFYL